MKTKNSPKVLNPSYDEISSRARDLWLSYGSPEGRDEEFWLSAERELRNPPMSKSRRLKACVVTSAATPILNALLHEPG
jgi:hypothetical protein